ncbi:MAG: aminotransferase class V-fold PLP-dependent enzyme [Candidatus Thorarchaeota archaeon]
MRDCSNLKKEFPVFRKYADLIYFDSASTSLIPAIVVERTTEFLSDVIVSSRRGAHKLAVKGGMLLEEVRHKLAQLIGSEPGQIAFQPSTSSAVTSLALGLNWRGDERSKIVVAQSEERDVYSSLQRVAHLLGLDFEVIPVTQRGLIDLDAAGEIIDRRTGLVAVGVVSPGTGVLNPTDTIGRIAHESGAILLSDATRALGFTLFDIRATGADIVVSSANIGLLGPPGLSIQWTGPTAQTHRIFDTSGMVGLSTEPASGEFYSFYDKSESAPINLPAVAGLGGAIDYLKEIGTRLVVEHIKSVSREVMNTLSGVKGLKLVTPDDVPHSIIGFAIEPGHFSGLSCHDIALLLDTKNIAVRSGMVCAQPLMERIAPDGVVQVSVHIYNTSQDVQRLGEVLHIIASEMT